MNISSDEVNYLIFRYVDHYPKNPEPKDAPAALHLQTLTLNQPAFPLEQILAGVRLCTFSLLFCSRKYVRKDWFTLGG